MSVGIYKARQEELSSPIERLDGRRFEVGLDLRDHPVANEDINWIAVTAVRPDAS